MKENIKKNYGITIAVIGIIVIGIVIIGLYFGKMSSQPMNYKFKPNEEEVITSNYKQITEDLRARVAHLRNKNAVISVIEGEELSTTFYYNKHGESLAVDNNMYYSIFKKDGYASIFEENYYYAENVDVLTLVDNMLKNVDGKEIYVTKPTPYSPLHKDNNGGFDVYTIMVPGYDNLLKIYNNVSDEYANNIVSSMYTAMKSKDFALGFRFVTTGNIADGTDRIDITCLIVDETDQYLHWLFEGYAPLGDWELEPEWYTNKNVWELSEETDEAVSELLGKELDKMAHQIQDIMDKYENPLDFNMPDNTNEVVNE